MSDKNITELEWKKFSKGKGYKDGAFVKALAALETGKTPEAKLAALDTIEKEGEALRKANKADKELGGYLDDAEKAVGKERKLQEAEAKKAAKQSASEDEEDDSPAALTGKMIPLLRQVKKGEAMKTMVAITGKEVAVMVSKRAISPAKRKLLTDYLGVSGGVKFAVGECIWEEKAVTFVLSTQAAGLAKKIKAALLKQVEQRMKVRVRGEDPDDIDDDGEPPDEEEGGEGEGQEGAKAQTEIPEAPPQPPTGEPVARQEAQPQSDEAAAFNARLAALMPKVKEAIAAAGSNATDIKLKVSEAGVAARKKEYGSANALLDEAERLLDAGGESPQEEDRAPAFNARLAALMPRVKEILSTIRHAGEVKLKVSEAGVAARKKDFGPANDLLDQAEHYMDLFEAYERYRADLEPRMLAALKTDPAEATRMRAVYGYAEEQAGATQLDKAMSALNRLDKMLGGAGSRELPLPPGDSTASGESEQSEGQGGEEGTGEQGEGGGEQAQERPGEKGYKGIVAYRTTLLELRAAVAKVEGQIAALVKAIPDQLPDEADLAEALADDLNEAKEELQDLVDAAMNTSENADTPITRALTARLDELIAEIATNEVIRHVDQNPFGVSTDIGATLGKALNKVRAALPVPA